jgi:hypothetical protein
MESKKTVLSIMLDWLLGRVRSVDNIAKLSCKASANDTHLFVPLGFLLTATACCHPGTFLWIQRAIRGSALKLSTGFPKKPCV